MLADLQTLSLHDALPISCRRSAARNPVRRGDSITCRSARSLSGGARKSTRLNSSHLGNSYAVFCLQEKQKENAELQNEKQKKIAGMHSATSRQNTKDHVY